jgi:hypothetical protein
MCTWKDISSEINLIVRFGAPQLPVRPPSACGSKPLESSFIVLVLLLDCHPCRIDTFDAVILDVSMEKPKMSERSGNDRYTRDDLDSSVYVILLYRRHIQNVPQTFHPRSDFSSLFMEVHFID